MGGSNLLTPDEVNIIQIAKAKKEIEKDREKLRKPKKELKPKTIGFKDITVSARRGISKLSKGVGDGLGYPFGGRPEPESFTKEQNILRGMFGHGGRVLTNMDGRSLPKIHNTLNSGGGLIKSGDNDRETAGIFGF